MIEPYLPWKLTLEINASSWDFLKYGTVSMLSRAEKARDYREMYALGAESGGSETEVSYSMRAESPVEERIKSLRAEADRLEAAKDKAA